MTRPIESDYASMTAYCRALEDYVDKLLAVEPVAFQCGSYYYPYPSTDAYCPHADKHVLLYTREKT